MASRKISKTYNLDANIVLRFLVQDDPILFTKAKKYFVDAALGKHSIYLDSVTVAEIIWVLSSFYRYNRTEISQKLLRIVERPWLASDRRDLIIEALNFYSTHNLSYIDCWLYCLSHNKNYSLVTFDAKLAKQ